MLGEFHLQASARGLLPSESLMVEIEASETEATDNPEVPYTCVEAKVTFESGR